jgi:hypothetical protein
MKEKPEITKPIISNNKTGKSKPGKKPFHYLEYLESYKELILILPESYRRVVPPPEDNESTFYAYHDPGDLDSLLLQYVEFDKIFLYYQFEQVEDVRTLMKNLHTLLKSSGTLLIQSSYYTSINQTVCYKIKRFVSELSILPWIKIEDNDPLYEFSKDLLLRYNIENEPYFKLESFFLSTTEDWSPSIQTRERIAFAQKNYNNVVSDIQFILTKI